MYSRKNPFPGRLLVNRRLNSPDSEKDTRHFEVALDGSGGTTVSGDTAQLHDLFTPDVDQRSRPRR